MAGEGRIQNIKIPYMTLAAQDDPPDMPDAGHFRMYFDESENAVKLIDSSGVTTTIGSQPSRVLLSTANPTGSGVHTFSSIPGIYKSLQIEAAIRGTNAAVSLSLYMEFNGDTTSGNYQYEEVHSNNYGVSRSRGVGALIGGATGAGGLANEFAVNKIEIPMYASSVMTKLARCETYFLYDVSSVYMAPGNTWLRWNGTGAITQIDLKLSAGNYDTNTEIRLYGVN